LRCESCLQVLSLRHAWDVAACGCGALLLSGRPARPSVHWLSGPGGGWTELEAEEPAAAQTGATAETGNDQGKDLDDPPRRLGFPIVPARPQAAVLTLAPGR
jgi:hypothetical protein